MPFCHCLIADGIGVHILYETGRSYQRGMLQIIPEQDRAAANEDCRVRTQVYLQFTQLIQNVFCVLFSGFADGILYIRGENGFLAAQHGADMFILNLHIMQGADPADDVIVHGNDAGFQTAAELHVRLTAAQEQNIGGVAANVDQKQAQVMLELAFLRRDGSVFNSCPL